MAITQDTLRENIEQAWELAGAAAENADDYASQALRAAQSFISGYGPDVKLDIGEPTPYDYTSYISSISEEVDKILNNDVINTKYKLFSGLVEKDTGLESIFGPNAEWNSRDPVEVIDTLSNAFTQQFTFGSSSGGFAQTVNDLASFLANGMIYDENGNLLDMTYGIPDDIEAKIRQRGYDTLMTEGLAAEEDVISTYAARGFPVPPGMIAARIEQIRDETLQAKGNLARDVAVQQGERGFQATGRNLQEFSRLQNSAQSYFQQYLDAAIKANSQKSDDMQFLIDAIINLRKAMIDMYQRIDDDRDLLLKEAIAEEELTISKNRLVVDEFSARIQQRVNAALSAAQAMGALAAAAVGSQNTMATIGHQTVDSGGASA